MNASDQADEHSAHEHIYRSGIDDQGDFQECQCGHIIRPTPTELVQEPDTGDIRAAVKIFTYRMSVHKFKSNGRVSYQEDMDFCDTVADQILALFAAKLAGLLEHQTAYLDDNHSTKNPAIAIPVSAVKKLLEELKS